MISAIKVRCEPCGEITLNAWEITVIEYGCTNLAEYRFTCPDCQKITVRNIDHQRILDLLHAYPINTLVVLYPAELDEHHAHPPIVPDDLIDAHDELEQL